MTGGEALDLIMARLGHLTDEEFRASTLLELRAMQRQLERTPTLPWFLLQDNDTEYATVANQEFVPLNVDFLRFDDELGGVWYRNTELNQADQWVALKRDDYNSLQAKYADSTTGKPEYWDSINAQLYLRKIPDAAYDLRVWAYFNDAPPEDNGNTTFWLTYADQWLVSATAAVMAATYLQNDAKAASLAALAQQAKNACRVESIAQIEALKNRMMGDS